MNEKLGLYRVKDQYIEIYSYKFTFITKIDGIYGHELCLYKDGRLEVDYCNLLHEYFINRLEYIGPYISIEEALVHCPEEFL